MWLTLQIGTAFGFSVRFREKLDADVVKADMDEGVEHSHEGAGLLLRLVKALRHSAKLADDMREDRMHLSMASVNVNGLGIGIPEVSASLYLGYKEDK